MARRRIGIMMGLFCLAYVPQLVLSGGRTLQTFDAASPGSPETALQASQGPQHRQFTNVEGADLKSKLLAATNLAKSRQPQSPFWIAYSFDVRPGIAVDPGLTSFSGSMRSFGGVTLFFGTSAGVAIETRNLAVFALIQPNDNAVSRIEVYNLEREREYSGYQVYWLGRAANQESLDYLKSLAESGAPNRVAQNAVMAAGMHDALQVSPMLKELTRRSSVDEVRKAAIFWLGFGGAEHSFLAEIVRNTRENEKIREAAVAAIGRGGDPTVLPVLQDLYGAVAERGVKQQIIYSIARNDNHRGAIDFLSKLSRTDSDRELRKTAVARLGKLPGTQASLADVARNEQEDRGVRETAVHAIGRSPDPGGVAVLQGLYKSVENREIRAAVVAAVARNADQQAAASFLAQAAKADPSPQLREHAISRLGRLPGTEPILLDIAGNEKESNGVRGAAISAIARSDSSTALSTLQRLYRASANREVKEHILANISRTQNQEAALDFIISVAESDPDTNLREHALSRLARSPSDRSFEMLKRLATSPDSTSELQQYAVNLMSRRPADEAVPALIEIAKSHPRAQVREVAIRRLGRMSDDRAKEFMRQLLSR